MIHIHSWRQSTTMLTLPDTDRYYDAVILWRCTHCGKLCHATGMLHEQTRTLHPDTWEAHCATERARGGPLVQEAHRQERVPVR